MTFQNCILINFVTYAWTDKLKAICSFNFSKVGGIKTCCMTDKLQNLILFKYMYSECICMAI